MTVICGAAEASAALRAAGCRCVACAPDAADVDRICENCGNDLASYGSVFCTDCLESL
jgi:predicted amidophosphoribosyltransferase